MIFKALADFYEALAAQGRIEKDGWMKKPAAREIRLDASGKLVEIADIRTPTAKGKLRPEEIVLPDWGSAAGSAIRAQFLCNASGYALGLTAREGKTGADRLEKMLENNWSLHHEILDAVTAPEARAVLNFLDGLYAGNGLPDAVVDGLDNDALTKDNFIFSVNGVRLHEIPEIQTAWNEKYANSGTGVTGTCLVTGEIGPIADKHPFIKGLRGAQGGGAGLSNYNCDSFCSYGKEQNFNAPVGRHAAFAYTTALTYLLNNPLYHRTFGENLTVVWWPEDADERYAAFPWAAIFDEDTVESRWTDSDIAAILDDLSHGRPSEGLDPDRKFYVLGLSPNSSRIIVRFFFEDTFGTLMTNVTEHYRRLEIERPDDAGDKPLSVYRVLRAMANKDVDKEIPGPVIEGLFQSILFDKPYPAQMLHATLRRLRAGDPVSWTKAAILKAYALKKLPENDIRRENFTMSLNPENRNPGYLLGRLFAIQESLQYRANGYKTVHNCFSAAMTTPRVIFGRLSRLAQIHLGTLERKKKGTRVWYDKQIQDIKALLGETYPLRLSLEDQCAFDLGYYHQKQALFAKKNDDGADADAGDGGDYENESEE